MAPATNARMTATKATVHTDRSFATPMECFAEEPAYQIRAQTDCLIIHPQSVKVEQMICARTLAILGTDQQEHISAWRTAISRVGSALRAQTAGLATVKHVHNAPTVKSPMP